MSREIELAILFADVSESTRLYETLGDTAARAIVAGCLDTMTGVTRRQGGLLVRTIGDEVMSTFRDADAAAAAAVAMQDAITGDVVARTRDVAIRIGFHFGTVLVDEGDVNGDAVNVAARVTDEAKPRQILTTAAAHERMGPRWQSCTRQIAKTELKGKREQVDVYEVIWQAEDATFMQAAPWAKASAAAGSRMVLSIGAVRIELGQHSPTFTAGRDGRNDVVLNDVIVSRMHARVDCRNGRFLLTDQSANGTFVLPDRGSGAFVHRDSVELSGSGLLGLGAAPAPGSRATIRYETG